jgi:Fe(3+) dicitrate transport protein
LTANKATNARQIFAQVVGLTINESSDGGLQLSIGGRGLDPNRTSNFNTRQNGLILAPMFYIHSYRSFRRNTSNSWSRLFAIRTQFGGLVNFKIKSPTKNLLNLHLETP